MEINIGSYTISGKHGDYILKKNTLVEATEKKEEHESYIIIGYYATLEQLVYYGICNKELSEEGLKTKRDILVKIRELRRLCKTLFADIKGE